MPFFLADLVKDQTNAGVYSLDDTHVARMIRAVSANHAAYVYSHSFKDGMFQEGAGYDRERDYLIEFNAKPDDAISYDDMYRLEIVPFYGTCRNAIMSNLAVRATALPLPTNPNPNYTGDVCVGCPELKLPATIAAALARLDHQHRVASKGAGLFKPCDCLGDDVRAAAVALAEIVGGCASLVEVSDAMMRHTHDLQTGTPTLRRGVRLTAYIEALKDSRYINLPYDTVLNTFDGCALKGG